MLSRWIIFYKIENKILFFIIRILLKVRVKMATLTTPLQHANAEQNMMMMIRVSIEKDIENGNCKPMEATRRYNNTARSMGLPPATDNHINTFKRLRANYNAARRRAREAAGAGVEITADGFRRISQEVRDACIGDSSAFRSIPPPRRIRRARARNNNVPDVPEEEECERGGGERKTSEPPMATNVVPVYNEWEIDPDIPYAIAV